MTESVKDIVVLSCPCGTLCGFKDDNHMCLTEPTKLMCGCQGTQKSAGPVVAQWLTFPLSISS